MRIHSLTTRFVLTLLLSTAVPFLVFAWFVRGELRERQVLLVQTLLAEASEGVRTRVAARLDALQSQCSVFRGTAERALAARGSVDEFRDEVEFSPGFDRNYDMVLLARADGTVATVVEGVGLASSASARSALRPRRVDDQPWFRTLVGTEATPAATNQVWIDRHLSPFLHRETERVSLDPAEYNFGLAFSVQSEGELVGVVLALQKWNAVQIELDEGLEGLRANLPSIDAFVAGGDLVLAHTERSRYGSALPPEAAAAGPFSFLDESGALWHGDVVDRMDVSDPLGWSFGVQASDADLFALSRQFGTLLILVTLVVAAILVGWSFFASRAILRPVRRLAIATEQIASGDLDARVHARGKNELADLARAFNAMAEEVAASREQLRTAERQAAWAEMARQVAHEIKNPLTPMRMSAQLLLRARAENSPRLPELVDRLARTVEEQTDQLARIATDFRQFAGEPARQRERVSAQSILDDVEQDFAATIESGVALSVDKPGPDLAAVQTEVDRHEIRRVFLNLVQNALDATGIDGKVSVSVELHGAGRAGATLAYRVIDDGPGVDPSVRDRLFEPYFTTRSSGTGLGLAICRRIVESHGGRIGLEASAPGRTEFRVDLPVASA